ncbi:MAG: tRNA pseudouridine(55) synthase TruB [Streptosporangiaceae bacterium]
MTPSGLVIVDKPAGLTSHDVVARIRRMAGTKRVGHAGTLDPMATGVLVVGVEKATRLLGHLTLTEKEYDATIRLGQTTDTDDAEGQVVSVVSAAGVTPERLTAGVAALRGEISQIPPAVSAIKVGGQRAYKLTREGAPPVLRARTVSVREFVVRDVRRDGDLLDADVSVTCSSGTYIRGLARDLGAALGVGGHLTCLRRTRVGPYHVRDAHTLDSLAESFKLLPLADAAAATFPRLDLTADLAGRLAHGGRLPADGGPIGGPTEDEAGPLAAFGPDGTLIALVTREADHYRPLAVFVP